MINSKKFAKDMIDARMLGKTGYLTIDHPIRKNAITREMWCAIPEAIHWLADDAGARCIVLKGGGTSDFSAGADISEFDEVRKDAVTARDYEKTNSDAFASIRTAPVPIIASIRGICFGGAFGLAAACDLRLCDHTARFAIPASRLGLAYPADAVADLVATLGAQKTRHLLLTASEMSAEEAHEAGFIIELTEVGNLETHVSELANTIAAAAPLSVRASRAAILAALNHDSAALAKAADFGSVTFESADYAEGRAAFRERRKPVFTGQ